MEVLINVAVPVFGIVLTGYLAGHFEYSWTNSAAALNRYVYFFALPPVLFVFTARAPIDKVLNWPFIGAFLGGSAITLVVALVVGRLWFRLDSDALSVHGLAAVFANTAYMGIPAVPDGVRPGGRAPGDRRHAGGDDRSDRRRHRRAQVDAGGGALLRADRLAGARQPCCAIRS